MSGAVALARPSSAVNTSPAFIIRAAPQNVALRCRDLPHCPHRAPVT